MKSLLLFVSLVAVLSCPAQEFTPLWPQGKKPNSNGIKITDSILDERVRRTATPGMYAFAVPAAENTGTAVLICPGGGYSHISHVYSGFQVAKWFNARGINAYVLIYRLPHQADLKERALAPLQDAQRALKILNANAAEWKLSKGKIGIMGASAGGHLASLAGTFEQDVSIIKDSLDSGNYRPDFMLLLSPVISMDAYAHKGSRNNLLGADTASIEMRKKYSTELMVTAHTAPSFLVHAVNDKSVHVRNSLLFYNALIEHKINASLHTFPQGGHGIRMTENPGSTNLWPELMYAWLKEMNFVTPVPFK